MSTTRTAPRAAAVALVAALVAGCGALGGGGDGGDGTDQPGTTGGSTNGDRPTSIDSGLLECGDPDGADPELQLTDVELTDATWDMPEGFTETFLYSEDNPVEHIDSTWTAEPVQDPVQLDVLAVVVYGELDWGEEADSCGRVPIEAVERRLEGYAEQIGAQTLSDAQMTEMAGLPAIQQDIQLDLYSYRGYWLFDVDQLMHVYCQWAPGGDQETVLRGCEELVASVEVPDGA